MKRILSLHLILALLALCGCESRAENTDTRFLLDTLVSLTAETDFGTLDDAFEYCSEYEKLLSRTISSSEISKINNSEDFCEVSEDTAEIVEKGLYYSEISGGRFDITICPVSSLWDFENGVVPERNEIAEALKNVDYERVLIEENKILAKDTDIELGAVAKGYIADKLLGFLKGKGVKNGIINLGGNVIVFGEKYRDVYIRNPFKTDENILTLSVKNRSVVTSGTYERAFKKDGIKYHHILDSSTGYPAESDLVSATVISENSADGDALSTCCILMGLKEAKELIENTPETEAVFITEDEKVYITRGLKQENGKIYIK